MKITNILKKKLIVVNMYFIHPNEVGGINLHLQLLQKNKHLT